MGTALRAIGQADRADAAERAGWPIGRTGQVGGRRMSDHDDDADDGVYRVVHNDEEQYSLWRADRELPLGWHAEGTQGSRQECLAHIERVWTDMRPLSVRRRMAQADA
jgi:MbtH protein